MIKLPNLIRFKNYDLRFRFSNLQIFLLFSLFVFLTLTSLLSVRLAHAQFPPPTVPCDAERYPEFHTLRPYQASPCDPNYKDLALFCGNDLILTDTIVVHRYGDPYLLYCRAVGAGEYEQCFYRVPRNLDLAIDVSGAHLPIMGLTEYDVKNSRNLSETRSDADKVNEYVSWYLEGVNLPVEYGALDPTSPGDISKLVNFSGPINRLIPERIKRDTIRQTIVNADKDKDIRHNQVIGCTNGLGQITECYPERPLVTPHRLSDLRGRLPPREESFSNYTAFLVAYKEWRGWRCSVVLGFPVCVDDPSRPNYWANLFYTIPPSSTTVKTSTEDRKGQIEVVNPYVQPVQKDVTITDVSIITSPADLFFAHMEEDRGLADILQGTYIPKGNPKSGPVAGVAPAEYCDLTEIRSNPGDDLFAGEIGVNVSYTAEFSCNFAIYDPPSPIDTYACSGLYGGRCYTNDYTCDAWAPAGYYGCPAGYRCGRGCEYKPPNQSCTRQAQVVLNTVTKTPLVNDIFSRLVAGVSGVFKRIFPKIEPGAPVEGLLDIPAATDVSYSLVDAPSSVSLSVGNPSNQRSALELYFPHIGSLHQYFLQCIQTALRPEGFGEVCPVGVPPAGSTGTCPSVPDSSVPGKWLGGFKSNFINLANRLLAGCTGGENNLADECYNYVVKESIDEGVNPAFSLTIWLAESGASNYCYGGPTTRDFGINDSSIFQNIVEQLNRFLALPFSGAYTYCRSQPGFVEPMHAFLTMFSRGDCDPSIRDYYDKIKNNHWQWVTGDCVSGGKFLINWPTDNSCP